jgi:F-type H+-transporting ATPase subunit gamma
MDSRSKGHGGRQGSRRVTADLENLAARIRAIDQTVPLLEAIRSVAEIAYRRTGRMADPMKDYSARVDSLFEVLSGLLNDEQRTALLAGAGGSGPTALLIVSSDRGLCGAFNSSLATAASRLVREYADRGDRVRIFCWGMRGKRLLETAGHEVPFGSSLASIALPTYAAVEQMALELLALRDQNRLGRILAMHHAPVRRFQYALKVEQLLPPDLKVQSAQQGIEVKPPGDVPMLATHLLTEWVVTRLYRIAVESSLSEQLARISTVRLAVDNARKLLEGLRFEYNLARQRQTTNSLLQIVSGFRALTET